jgi:hypothetical protein
MVYQRLIRIILSFIFFISQIVWPGPSEAATYTETWTTQGDFENNDTTTRTPTTRLNVDTSTNPGDVSLDTWPTGHYIEDFTTQNYMDPVNTTATWDTQAGEIRLPAGIATDLKAKFIALWGTNNNVLSSLYANGKIYVGTNIGKFGSYDMATGEVVDLTSYIAFWSGYVNKMIFDPNNSDIYLGGMSRKFAKYNIPTRQATDLSGRVSFMTSQSAIYGMALDEARGMIYLGSNKGEFAKYNPSLDQATDLTSKIGFFWSTNAISELKYEPLNYTIYIGGWSGQFAQYDPATDTALNLRQQIVSLWGTTDIVRDHVYLGSKVYLATSKGRFGYYDINTQSLTDLTDKIYSFWGAWEIATITLDSNNNQIYMGGATGKFAKYNPASGSATDLSSKISGFWSNRDILALTFDTANNDIYLGGSNYYGSRFARYNTQTEIATNLADLISGVWFNTAIRCLAFDATNNAIYLGGSVTANRLAKFIPATGQAVNLTDRILPWWGSAAVQTIAFDTLRSEIYLGGESGKFAKYNPSTDLAADLTGRISSFWSTSIVYSLEFAPYNNNIYLGGGSGKFAKYDPGSDSATNLRTRISSFWPTANPVYALTVDGINNDLYLGGSAGKFAKYSMPQDSATDCSTYVTGLYDGINSIYGLTFTPTNEVFMGFSNGKFAKYAVVSGVITDLTNRISSFWSTNTIMELAYHSGVNKIYLVGTGGLFAVFDHTTQLATDLTSTISPFWGAETINAIVPDDANDTVYISGDKGRFAKFDATSGLATNLFPDIAVLFQGSTDIVSMAYDLIRRDVYVASGSAAKFGRYNLDSGIAVDLTSRLSGITAWAINSLLFDSSRGCIYLGGRTNTGVLFGRYDTAQDQVTDLYSYISSFWASSDTIYSMSLDSANNVYIGAYNGRFAKFNPAIPEATDLTSRISSFWSTNFVGSMAFDSVNQDMYLGGTSWHFAKYSILGDIATDLSDALVSLNWQVAVTSLAFDSINNGIYVGGNAFPISDEVYEVRFVKYQTPAGPAVDLKNSINSFFGRQGAYGWLASNMLAMNFNPDNGSMLLGGNYSELAKFSISTQTGSDLSGLIEPFWGIDNVNALTYATEGKSFIGGVGTEFTVLDTPASAQAQSINLNSTGNLVGWATLTKADIPGSGAAHYYLSNNGGQNFSEVTPGQQFTFTTFGSDLRWRIVVSGEAVVQAITIDYEGYYSLGTIQDLKINAGGVSGWAGLTWNVTLNGQTVKFRTRSADTEANLDTAAWSGYYTTSGSDIISPDNQWLEIETTLETVDGSRTPSLQDFSVVYVINGPPEVANVTAYEDGNGVVQIEYDVRDIDTNDGTAHPGSVDISFRYWNGSQWIEATTTTGETRVVLSTGDPQIWTHYTGTWNAKADFGGQYMAGTAKIRVVADDGEALYNIGTGDSAGFILDTRNPSSPSIVINSGAQKTNSVNVTLALSAFDNTMPDLQMMISNNSDFQGAAYEPYVTSKDWVLTEGDGDKTVYAKFKDVYGNEASVVNDTIELDTIAPPVPQNIYIDDVSNPETLEWRLFLTWGVVDDPHLDFQQYNIWRSTDGVDYGAAPYMVITNRLSNYYLDQGLDNTITYYYKITSQDNIGNISAFSQIVAARPNGTGGADEIPPIISNVQVESVGWTSATITWTTDELSDSTVGYSTDYSFLAEQGHSRLVELHSIGLVGLTSGTIYYFRVQSKDEFSNLAVDDNHGTGYAFTTLPGEDEVSEPPEEEPPAEEEPEVTQTQAEETQAVASQETSQAEFNSAMLPAELFGLSKGEDKKEQAQEKTEEKKAEVPLILTKGPAVINISANSATIIWVTDRPASSIVSYRIADSAPNVKFTDKGDSANLIAYHSILLSDLQPGTAYEYTVKSIDSSGKIGSSKLDIFKTIAIPAITDVNAYDITLDSAVISWNTSNPSVSVIEYGINESYGKILKDQNKVQEHTVKLSGLESATTYHFIIRGSDDSGKLMVSEDNTFQTFTEPRILDFQVKKLGFNKALVEWKTNVSTDSEVKFTPYRKGEISKKESKTQGKPDLVLDHKIELANLEPDVTYEITLQGKDIFSNQVSMTVPDFIIESEKTPPVISQVRTEAALASDRADGIQTLVYWKTDELSTSRVKYQDGSVDKSEKWIEELPNNTPTTEHLIVVNSFKPGTVYRIKAISADGFGNEAESQTFTILTPKKKKGVVQIIIENFEDAFGWFKNLKVLPK